MPGLLTRIKRFFVGDPVPEAAASPAEPHHGAGRREEARRGERSDRGARSGRGGRDRDRDRDDRLTELQRADSCDAAVAECPKPRAVSQ